MLFEEYGRHTFVMGAAVFFLASVSDSDVTMIEMPDAAVVA